MNHGRNSSAWRNHCRLDVRKVFGAGVKTVRAAAKTAAGKGSFNENMEVAFRGLGQFELRLNDVALGKDGSGPVVKAIECNGLFPESVVGNVAFLVSLFDNTSEELQPVIAVLEDCCIARSFVTGFSVYSWSTEARFLTLPRHRRRAGRGHPSAPQQWSRRTRWSWRRWVELPRPLSTNGRGGRGRSRERQGT